MGVSVFIRNTDVHFRVADNEVSLSNDEYASYVPGKILHHPMFGYIITDEIMLDEDGHIICVFCTELR